MIKKIYSLMNKNVLLSFATVDMLMIPFIFLTVSMRLYFSLNFSIHSMITLSLLWEKTNNTMAFLDVFINNKDPTNLMTSVGAVLN